MRALEEDLVLREETISVGKIVEVLIDMMGGTLMDFSVQTLGVVVGGKVILMGGGMEME